MIGEAGGIRPLAPTRRWEGTAGGPESQETTSDRKPNNPRGKGWLMYRSSAIKAGAAALCGAVTVGAGASLALAGSSQAASKAATKAAPKVTVTVVGRTRTLLAATPVQPKAGWITRGGAPVGKCPDDSAQGALNVATHGHWTGSWYASYHEYYITGILGESQTGKKYYWGLYVNGRLASAGACDITLKAGEKLLFKVTKS